MFRIVNVGNTLPCSYPVDPSAEFQAGQVAELVVLNNQIVATVSNGTGPIGIIDDFKTRAFTNNAWNEVVIAPATGVRNANNQLVTPVDVKVELAKANILPSSFATTVNGVLNPVNGVITFLAGTPLNFDLIGSGEENAIRAIVNYTYQVANVPGDDSTAGSNRVTIWYGRMFFQTDQYETNQQYPLKANLYVNEFGLLTTRKPSPHHPVMAMVTAPPSPLNPMLEVFWF